MVVGNGTVQTVAWTMPGPLMASISMMLAHARALTPEHSMSLCGHTRSVQRNWRSREAGSSNLGIETLPKSEPQFAAYVQLAPPRAPMRGPSSVHAAIS